ncbi:unnamed protein product [Camellia sinensis]
MAYPSAGSTKLFVVAVPNYLSPDDFLLFFGSHLDHFSELCFLRNNGMEDRYSVLIMLANQLTADGFYCNFNGKQFRSSELESYELAEEACSPLTGFVELPTCPVCLGAIPFPADVERLKDLGVCGAITLTEPYETLVPTSLYQIQAGVLSGDVSDIVLLNVTPLSIGLETLGGVMKKIITRNITLPTSKSEVFSTAANGQTSVEINVLQDEREFVRDNKSLGSFRLDGIPPAPRGVPQIEVKFDIDANGILSITAVDKGIGKKQDITITGDEKVKKDGDHRDRDKDRDRDRDQDRDRLSRNKKRRGDRLIHESNKENDSEDRLGRTLLGSITRYFSSNQILFISFTVRAVLCFVLMGTQETATAMLGSGIGNWKLILNSYHDIFEERTENLGKL